MPKPKKITESEYRFLIPRSKLGVKPDEQIAGFELVSEETVVLEDVLFERKGKTLKSENIGLRVRMVGNQAEFTYKKFLGSFGGVAKFDEITVHLNDKAFRALQKGSFNFIQPPIIEKLREEGGLYMLLTIKNMRRVFHYVNKFVELELVVEDIKYISDQKHIGDAMIEIEIKGSQHKDIPLFVETIKKLFVAKEASQGKNSRGAALLGIKL